jgi:hypothetical protein
MPQNAPKARNFGGPKAQACASAKKMRSWSKGRELARLNDFYSGCLRECLAIVAFCGEVRNREEKIRCKAETEIS